MLDDISDGDYLLESLRDFRPPTSDQRNQNVSIFEGKGKQPDKLQIIGGNPKIRNQVINDDSLDELRFFDKPLDKEYEKDAGGFQRLV